MNSNYSCMICGKTVTIEKEKHNRGRKVFEKNVNKFKSLMATCKDCGDAIKEKNIVILSNGYVLLFKGEVDGMLAVSGGDGSIHLCMVGT